MKKHHIKRLLVSLIVIVIPVFAVNYTQVLFSRNSVYLGGYYKEMNNSLDVVLMGASEVRSDFQPDLAYKKYGFTSYDYVVDSNIFDLYKYQLEEVYRTQTPKVVVIDISPSASSICNLEKDKKDAVLRKFTDNIPLSDVKIKTVQDLGETKHWLSYYLPSIMYHGQIFDLNALKNKIWFENKPYSLFKGATVCTANERYDSLLRKTNEKLSLSKEGTEKVTDLLDFCQESNYHVLFVKFPHLLKDDVTQQNYMECNYVAELIRKRGFDFLDMEELTSNGFLEEEDFKDMDHLNFFGQRKLTAYLSECLLSKYDLITSSKSEAITNNWSESVRYYDMIDELSSEKPFSDDVYHERIDFIEKIERLYSKQRGISS